MYASLFESVVKWSKSVIDFEVVMLYACDLESMSNNLLVNHPSYIWWLDEIVINPPSICIL